MRGFGKIVRYLTFQKVTNAFLVLFSFYVSRLLKRPMTWGLPVSMSIEPTTACNLGCTQCPSGLKQFTRPTGSLKPEIMSNLIREIKNKLVYLTLYFQGEPFIHKQFLELVRIAHLNNVYTSTSTNAHFLNEKTAKDTVLSGLDKIIISVDGTTQESYEKYRIGGSLEQVIEGIKNLKTAKKELKRSNPYIEVQFIVFRHNEHEIEEIKNMSAELGVDKLVLKTAQIYDFPDAEQLLPQNEKYGRYLYDQSENLKIKNKFYNHCWRMWHSCVITWNGTVVPCCFDKDASYEMGNIQENSLKEIWSNDTYANFRKKLIKKRSAIDICTNCTEGTKVWI